MNKQGNKISGINYINMDLLQEKLGFKHKYLILMKSKSLNIFSKYLNQVLNGYSIKLMKQYCSKKLE